MRCDETPEEQARKEVTRSAMEFHREGVSAENTRKSLPESGSHHKSRVLGACVKGECHISGLYP